jgi:hypothetical protein
MIIMGIYRPPNSNFNIVKTISEILALKEIKDKMVINGGDLNMPNGSWINGKPSGVGQELINNLIMVTHPKKECRNKQPQTEILGKSSFHVMWSPRQICHPILLNASPKRWSSSLGVVGKQSTLLRKDLSALVNALVWQARRSEKLIPNPDVFVHGGWTT